MRALPRLLVAALSATPLVLSCSPSIQPAKPRAKPVASADAGADAPTDPRWLPGHVVAQVPEGTFGPYAALGANGGMTLHAANGKERRWIATPLDARGVPSAAPKDVGRAPDDVAVVVVRPGAPRDGFVALWVRRSNQGTSLETVTLDPDGRPRTDPATVSQVSGQIVWADVVMVPSGPILFWAEQRRDKAAISSIRLDSTGRIAGQPTMICANARAWQIALTSNGVAMALVQPSDGAATGFKVSLQLIDTAGQLVGQPVAVSDSPTASPDVDVVRVGGSLVVAWTDHRDTDNHVFAAALDFAGKVTSPPHPITPPLGEQSFVALVASRSGREALIAWEDLSQRSPRSRAFRVGTIDAAAAAGPRTLTIPFHGGDRELPEFAAAPGGWAVITSAPACGVQAACEPTGPVASYLRLDEALTPVGGAPLLVDKLSGAVPASAWGLGCSSKECSVLVTGFVTPAPVAAVPLPPKKGTYPLAATAETRPTPPSVVSNTVVRSLEHHISELSAANVAGNTLVGWVTYFVEPPNPARASTAIGAERALAKTQAGPGSPPGPAIPGDPKKPTAANLSVVALDAEGKQVGAPTVVSVRALSMGGVSIAPGAQGTKDACVAWVARDAGDPQVFVTRINAEGKREGQQMLTRIKGDAADAAVAWAGDGWVVAWVDWRDGNGEVYAAKVDRNLRKVVNDTRLTNAAGDASDVSLAVRGNEVFVTFSDPREHSADQHGDPYLVRVQAANLARIGDEQRLASSPHHARTPRVAFSGQDIVAGWLAQPLIDSPSDSQSSTGPQFVKLDPKTGASFGNVISPRFDEARMPTSFNFSCNADACRGFVASSVFDSLIADAIVWFPGSPAAQTRKVAALSGPPGQDISPSVVGDDVFFVVEAGAGDVRIRRTRLAWTTQ
ncbi:MAG TPA: hypothetical protein PLI95_03445 [Polyangiaceae bacterium]|nr:hypothetical protein [Polyangiaceae bacterium]